MRITVLILTISVAVVIGAEMIPSVESCAAVFTGQVIADELTESQTNRVGPAQYGLFRVSELHQARIKVESVIKRDRPLANEVIVYYHRDASQACPRPVRLSTWERAKFYCFSGDIGALTNVLVIPMASFVTNP
jgi:hypothetical protein